MSKQVVDSSKVKSDREHLTRYQKSFLRAYRQYPGGPPAQMWPAPAVFRRWLRKPRFRHTIDTIAVVQKVTADLHLSAATMSAARAVHALAENIAEDPSSVEKGSPADAMVSRIWPLLRILRMSHNREQAKFSKELKEEKRDREQMKDWIAVERIRYEDAKQRAQETDDEELQKQLDKPFDRHIADLWLPEWHMRRSMSREGIVVKTEEGRA